MVAGSSRPEGMPLNGDGAAVGAVRASDGVELRYLRWPAEAREPTAVLVFLHGIASHAGWFGETASDLATRGVIVYGPDRRGSGRSRGRRGHLTNYERAIEDLGHVIELVSSEQENTPLFLAASSWAAKLAIVYCATHAAQQVSGLMLLGPGLIPRVNLSPASRLAVALSHLIVPTARFRIPLTPELYTANPRYVALIRADPRRLLTATSQFFWETSRLDRLRGRSSARLRLPLLVLQGESDQMMDVPGTRRWFDGLDLEDKTYIGYPGAGHTLDFEPDRERYVADMLSWLSAHLSRPAEHASGT